MKNNIGRKSVWGASALVALVVLWVLLQNQSTRRTHDDGLLDAGGSSIVSATHTVRSAATEVALPTSSDTQESRAVPMDFRKIEAWHVAHGNFPESDDYHLINDSGLLMMADAGDEKANLFLARRMLDKFTSSGRRDAETIDEIEKRLLRSAESDYSHSIVDLVALNADVSARRFMESNPEAGSARWYEVRVWAAVAKKRGNPSGEKLAQLYANGRDPRHVAKEKNAVEIEIEADRRFELLKEKRRNKRLPAFDNTPPPSEVPVEDMRSASEAR